MQAPIRENDLAASIGDASEPLIYNSMLFENCIRMVKTRYPEIDVNEILKNIKVEPWELADPAQWMGQHRYNALHRELERVFGKSRAISPAREAGRFAGTNSSKKLMREVVYAMLSPTRAYHSFGDIARRFSRASDYTSQRIGKNEHQVIITYKDGVNPQPFQCQTYKGYLEAIFFLFENKWPKIDHSQCHFRGDGRCVYRISWSYSTSQALNRMRNYLILLTIAGLVPLLVIKSFDVALATVVVSSIAGLTLSLLAEYVERRSFFSRVQRQRISPLEKVEGYDRFHNFARLFNEISRHLSKHTTFGEVLKKLSQILQGLSYERGIIFIIDQEHDFSLLGQPFGLGADLATNLRAALETMKNQFHKIPPAFKAPQVIREPQSLPSPFPEAFKVELEKLGEMIFIPMTYENTVLGFFLVENRYGPKPLMASDLNLLTTLASQTVLSILNIAAFESALRNEQLRNEFVAIASHELRTPIQVILLALEEVQLALPREVEQGLAMELEALGESSRRLEHIVNEILDINKLETRKSKINRQKVNIQTLIGSLKMETDGVITPRGHAIRYQTYGLNHLHCDPDLMIQTLANLVNNAAKYTPDCGKIELIFKQTDTDITIECLDNGIGIPKQFQDKIFMKFFQVEEARLQDKSGCGLGLSLCREIVKKHGGYISVESPLKPDEYSDLELGWERKGTKFSLHLKP